MDGFFRLPGLEFRWEPEASGMAGSGDLGYTFGTYSRTFTGPDGAENRQAGRYLSVWRRQPDGSWKVVADTGN